MRSGGEERPGQHELIRELGGLKDDSVKCGIGLQDSQTEVKCLGRKDLVLRYAVRLTGNHQNPNRNKFLRLEYRN